MNESVNFLCTPDFWSIVASVVSVALGVFAIVLSIYFYAKGRQTEVAVSSSLTQIQTQAEMLQKLAGRQLDRLTKYVTEGPTPAKEESLPQIEALISKLPEQLTAVLAKQPGHENFEHLRGEVVTCYCLLYFYTAQANFWAQMSLPPIDQFDPKNQFHAMVKRILDMSERDFNTLANLLPGQDLKRIEGTPAFQLVHEAKDQWRNAVRSTEQAFIDREQWKKQGQQTPT
jgi:hypothetical protein